MCPNGMETGIRKWGKITPGRVKVGMRTHHERHFSISKSLRKVVPGEARSSAVVRPCGTS